MPATAPSSSVRSWRQMVLDSDPNYEKESRRPIVYEFSNKRKFEQKPDPYSTP